MVISILIAIGIPLLFLYLIWALEIYAISRMKLLIGAFAWGIVSFGIAFVLQTALIRANLLTFQQVSIFVAPLLEETLKAALLFWLVHRMQLRYAVDGASYGFAIGTGFAVVENLLYLNAATGTGLDVALARVLSVSLMHAFTTAIVGTVAGSNYYRTFNSRLKRGLAAQVFVEALHFGFNQAANQLEGLPLIVVGIAIGLSGTAIILVLIRRALVDERDWIDRQLTNDLSPGERAATANPQVVAQLLIDHKQIIGEQRAETIMRYVNLQAQRGILRKTLLLNRRPKYDTVLKNHLHEIEQELDEVQTDMGLYTLVWLRSVLPSEESEVWVQLDHELHETHPILNLLVTLGKRQAEISYEETEARKTLLRESKLFYELPDDELEDVALLMSEASYTTGDVVIARGVVDECLYSVVSGELVVSVIDDSANETIISAHARGDTFGELSMIDLCPHPTTVSCLEDVRLYKLARGDLLTLIYAKPQVGVELMRQLVGQIRQETALLMWMRQTSALRLDDELLDNNPT